MNTTPQPQSPFVPVSPPQTSSTPPAAERPRRAKKPKVPKKPRRVAKDPALTAPYVAPAPKKVRKARVAKADKAVVKRTLDINSIVSATVGLKADEAKMLLSIVGKLNDFNKSGKLKVVGALGKLFG